MFKNRAMYVEMVPKKAIDGIAPIEDDPKLNVELITELINDSGKNVVKGVVVILAAYFGFKTASHVIINNSEPSK